MDNELERDEYFRKKRIETLQAEIKKLTAKVKQLETTVKFQEIKDNAAKMNKIQDEWWGV